MATIVLSAVGAGLGASVGGSVLGLSSAVIGRAVGATLGRAIDERLLGGSVTHETGQVERFHLSGASEGAPVAEVFGRTRVGGQVIWASKFLEDRATTRAGGKGSPGTKTTTFSYSVSLAVALCRGEILNVARCWADGREIALSDLNFRVYPGSEDQLPDPKIEAVEGAGNAPSYRGTAYVVFEDLELAEFGNRVPQLSFEVLRPARPESNALQDVTKAVRGVALVPGTGEYALATTRVHFDRGLGVVETANENSGSGETDFVTSINALQAELPNAGAASLVVSWFGDDLRAGHCEVQPKVEQADVDGTPMAWSVSGSNRSMAAVIPQVDGRPVYGGTPADAAVVEAIQHLKSAGIHATFYPFILMDQLAGNGLPDPWSGAGDQPTLPWRGRITASVAPGLPGTPDGTAAAAAEVAAFFGTCVPSDFQINGSEVSYSGPNEWSYRRFILHYAHLCVAAGGVDAFCIGSEMRSLTQIRSDAGFPAVDALIALAADVRAVVGPACKITYAADWSEYFGYRPQDGSGDIYFHLDPLWSDPNIDFIGIDNYLPVSDWRDGVGHADAAYRSIYNLDYLKSGILGGKHYDWYYASEAEEDAQVRTPIDDTAYGEDWVFRAKDLPNWWANEHFERIGGVKVASPTGWVPQSKPFWFTEYGCAAIDKGTNEPNLFLDPKSSESAAPRYSTGRRDDFLQAQYLRAMAEFWDDPINNPVSAVYGGPMVDMSKAHVWAYDTRPYPHFPADLETWSDGDNYARGHWISGRLGSQSLASVVAEVCERAGVQHYDVSALYGNLRGYRFDGGLTPRGALEPLMLAYGFDASERAGVLHFRSRTGLGDGVLAPDMLAELDRETLGIERLRAPDAEIAGRIRLNFSEADGDFAAKSAESIFPDRATHLVDQTELPLVLTQGEAQEIVERWLSESRVARDGLRFALPPSQGDFGAGDVLSVSVGDVEGLFRINRSEVGGKSDLEAVRIETNLYQPADRVEEPALIKPNVPGLPVLHQFLDLPLLRGTEVVHAPHIAATADPWPGGANVYSSASADGFEFNTQVLAPALIGETLNALDAATPWVWDRGVDLLVQFGVGSLASAEDQDLLNGANLAAIGDGTAGNWEVFQFARAEMVGPQTWALSQRLRGQAGTENLVPNQWPAGSRVVILDSAVQQVELSLAERGLERTFRVGPAGKAFDDASYQESTLAFKGVGLRPYAPVHLSVNSNAGDLQVNWVRRTRIDGDSWQSVEVPVGEEAEAYVVRIVQNGSTIRETSVSAPTWVYLAADQAADGAVAPFEIEVAQVSQAWGPGSFARIIWNG